MSDRVDLRWILVGAAVLFGAYVCGRAVGILLDVSPYVTEVIAIALALAASVWTVARRR